MTERVAAQMLCASSSCWRVCDDLNVVIAKSKVGN